MKADSVRYGKCDNCRGRVVERRMTLDLRFHGRLFEFEKVPVGVCRDCGQRVFKGPVPEQVERLAESKSRFKNTIQVPLAEFEPVEAW